MAKQNVPPQIRRKNKEYADITKKGGLKSGKKEEQKYTASKALIVFLCILVIGGTVVEMLRMLL